MQTSSDPKLPNYLRPELEAMSNTLTLMDDLSEGPERMWEKSSTYIRKWKHEDPDVYDIRRQCEPCFGGLPRTVGAGAGMLFAKSPSMTWNASETALSPIWDNVDNGGTKGTVLLKRFTEWAIRDGLGIIFVDYSKPPTGVLIHAGNEKQFGIRPTWAVYTRAQGINWFANAIENKQRLTRLTLVEASTVEDGNYGVKVVERYRELKLILTPDGMQATWTLRELDDSEGAAPDTFIVRDSGVFKNRKGVIADFLPVAIAYTGLTNAPMTASIPLAGVGYANLAHWRYSTNLTFNREVCGFEQLVITGELMEQPGPGGTRMPGELKIGPLVAIHLAAGGTAEWIGPGGKGLEQLEKGAQEKTVEMDQMGLGFLIPQKTSARSATEVGIESYARLATLATEGVGIQDAANAALAITAWYEGIEKAGAPVITINVDFEQKLMDGQTMQAWAAFVKLGFPKRQVLEQMQLRGWIAEDADLDAIEIAWETGMQAEEDAKAQEAALRKQEQEDAALANAA